jgi:hypothetical protein
MNAANAKVGGAGAARPAQVGKQGGLAPSGAQEQIEFVNAEKIVEAAINKRLSMFSAISNEKVREIVRYGLGMAGATIDIEDKDVRNALTIVGGIVQDLKQLLNHQISGARFLVEYIRYMGLEVKVGE